MCHFDFKNTPFANNCSKFNQLNFTGYLICISLWFWKSFLFVKKKLKPHKLVQDFKIRSNQ